MALASLDRRRSLALLGGAAATSCMLGSARAQGPKRLVVCCDGTWNDAFSKTHIDWIATHCQGPKASPLPQQVVYFSGVGTHFGNKLAGGALGTGLSHNVRDAYSFIRDHWQPGDELFIFGFSRGAYTARSLCGFMHLVGWLDDPASVDGAYLWYRLSHTPANSLTSRLVVQPLGHIVKRHSKAPIDVTFLGVFDTVGALGIPWRTEDLAADLGTDKILDQIGIGARVLGQLGALEDKVRLPIEGFHDTTLSERVKNASHALAVDERRGPFLPTLWTAAPAGSMVDQVWFAGVHGDVGGNYHQNGGDRLAVIPLLWTLDKATALGLELEPGAMDELRNQIDPLAPQHESLTPGWELLDVVTRPIGNAARARLDPSGQQLPRVDPPDTIHASVRQRVGKEVEVRLDSAEHGPLQVYNPLNLPPAN